MCASRDPVCLHGMDLAPFCQNFRWSLTALFIVPLSVPQCLQYPKALDLSLFSFFSFPSHGVGWYTWVRAFISMAFFYDIDLVIQLLFFSFLAALSGGLFYYGRVLGLGM
jgi:hypothetical protein